MAHFRVFHTSWWFSTRVWVTAILLKSLGLFLVFRSISTMLLFGCSSLSSNFQFLQSLYQSFMTVPSKRITIYISVTSVTTTNNNFCHIDNILLLLWRWTVSQSEIYVFHIDWDCQVHVFICPILYHKQASNYYWHDDSFKVSFFFSFFFFFFFL